MGAGIHNDRFILQSSGLCKFLEERGSHTAHFPILEILQRRVAVAECHLQRAHLGNVPLVILGQHKVAIGVKILIIQLSLQMGVGPVHTVQRCVKRLQQLVILPI